MAVKQCTKCGISKQLSEFYKQAKGKDGLNARCKSCVQEVAKIWYQDNSETLKKRLEGRRRAAGIDPRPKEKKKNAYYYKMRDDPEFKRKRKEYSAKRNREKFAEENAKKRAWALANPERVNEIARQSRARRQLLYIYRNIKKRAKARGMEFTIDYEDLVVPEVCPIFGVPLKMNATIDDYDFAPSVDRIDSTKGYVKGNVWVISRLANCMKWTATKEQLLAFAQGIMKMYSK